MAQTAQTQNPDPTQFATLHDATRRYRLHDSGMTNAQLAAHLRLENCAADFRGSPNCCFYGEDGGLVAIRTKQDEVAIFHLYQRVQRTMEAFGERIE